MKSKKIFAAGIALIVLLVATVGAQEEATERNTASESEKANESTIPLDHIWSNGMPGTIGAREMGPKAHELCDKIINLLIDASDKVIRANKKANPGFIVEGTGLAALQHTEVSLRTGKEMHEAAKESEITMVFFTCQLGDDVQLLSAARSGNKVTINYCFVTHPERNTLISFALIPLGRLPVGKYNVQLQQMPSKLRLGKVIKPMNPPSFFTEGSKYICQPFSFDVRDNKN